MSVVGDKQSDITGKITSITIRESGSQVNLEADVGSFGIVFGTVNFNPSVDANKETGTVVVRGQALRPDGTNASFRCAGTWRKSGRSRWEIKHISIDDEGQRMFVVDEFDLENRSTTGVVYALD